MDEQGNGAKKDPFEQSYFELATCPKCEFAYFDIENRDGEWPRMLEA